MSAAPDLERLARILVELRSVAVAVSGGVDSMTLASVAARELGAGAHMIHAVSPAVPAQATERVTEHAEREGWRLELIDAGEFDDPHYLANPVNRCYFCKSHLYDAVLARVGECTDATVVSGTNADDLGDYRPGLVAASEHDVRHPYVEAGIDKAGVRAIAAALGLDALAELPAAPCLSSRVETGIAIDPAALGAINDVEVAVARAHAPRTVRCRVRGAAIVLELDEETLARLGADDRAALRASVARRFREAGLERPVGFSAYRRGSAFVHETGR